MCEQSNLFCMVSKPASMVYKRCCKSSKREERDDMRNIFNAEQNGVESCLCRRANFKTIFINSVSK